MHKNIPPPLFRNDEAIPLFSVEPLHFAFCHGRILLSAHEKACVRLCKYNRGVLSMSSEGGGAQRSSSIPSAAAMQSNVYCRLRISFLHFLRMSSTFSSPWAGSW